MPVFAFLVVESFLSEAIGWLQDANLPQGDDRRESDDDAACMSAALGLMEKAVAELEDQGAELYEVGIGRDGCIEWPVFETVFFNPEMKLMHGEISKLAGDLRGIYVAGDDCKPDVNFVDEVKRVLAQREALIAGERALFEAVSDSCPDEC